MNAIIPQKFENKSKILICDDDAEFCSELSEALIAQGYPTVAMMSLSTARAAIVPSCILLLDLYMPKHTGVEILEMLGGHPRRDEFAIILMSGFSQSTIGAAAMLCEKLGLKLLGTLTKPINLVQLNVLLRSFEANLIKPDLTA